METKKLTDLSLFSYGRLYKRIDVLSISELRKIIQS